MDSNASDPYIIVDGNTNGDLDFDVSVSGSTVNVSWISKKETLADSATAADEAQNMIVKSASIDLTSETSFTAATVSGPGENFRFLPQSVGDATFYAETISTGGVEYENAMLKAYLMATEGLDDDDFQARLMTPTRRRLYTTGRTKRT